MVSGPKDTQDNTVWQNLIPWHSRQWASLLMLNITLGTPCTDAEFCLWRLQTRNDCPHLPVELLKRQCNLIESCCRQNFAVTFRGAQDGTGS
jgi:hypothetical protein